MTPGASYAVAPGNGFADVDRTLANGGVVAIEFALPREGWVEGVVTTSAGDPTSLRTSLIRGATSTQLGVFIALPASEMDTRNGRNRRSAGIFNCQDGRPPVKSRASLVLEGHDRRGPAKGATVACDDMVAGDAGSSHAR